MFGNKPFAYVKCLHINYFTYILFYYIKNGKAQIQRVSTTKKIFQKMLFFYFEMIITNNGYLIGLNKINRCQKTSTSIDVLFV